MAIKVGIPKSLLFYEYYPLWISFFEGLGAEVIVSDDTNKEILDIGVKASIDEACIPVKIFHGHVINIKDKVDYLFIPRIKSLFKNEYICPKFSGLPEMIKSSIKELPPIIDVEINFFKSKKHLKDTVIRAGRYVSSSNRVIMSSYNRAYLEYKKHRKKIKEGIINELTGADIVKNNIVDVRKVMVMGHPYNLYDSYLNMNLLNKIKQNEAKVFTPEMIDDKYLNKYVKDFDGELYWTFARKLIGTALYLSHKECVDGIIYISTFGCGIDSVVGDIVEKLIRRNSRIPFVHISLDEHSGEAGINTRVEAFMDMIKWRDVLEDNISAHG